MLRFIDDFQVFAQVGTTFQYIPCYGLSKHTKSYELIPFLFQYIPCYGLSVSPWINHTDVPEFQYIPCYGLSGLKIHN